jgi:serine/threonine protein kinase
MGRYWNDLRKLIDRRKARNKNQIPLFKKALTNQIMFNIATGMQKLHQLNILHRDLKASNVLIAFEGPADDALMRGDDDMAYFMRCLVADFECSVCVQGTGFWRAPEILQAVKNGTLTSNTFTKMADVYSYAMTYYEVLTGLFPFNDLLKTDYDGVLGKKPVLPDHVDPDTRKLLDECWDLDPLKRPTFDDIHKRLKQCLVEKNMKKL